MSSASFEDVANVSIALSELEDKLDKLYASIDAFYIIVMGILVFLMQGGFAFLEAGAVRSKNTVNILVKNTLDCLIGAFAYWSIGWAVAYGPGGNAFIGASQFFSAGLDQSKYALWFFQFTFAATTATIVSGAIAERCQLAAYFIYSAVLTGWIYPVVSHWAWDSSGWLLNMGYQDFAGSGAVHMLSGLTAMIATFLMGPRLGRFDSSTGKPIDMPGHSVPFAALGGFILIFGFLAFNGGSLLAIAAPGNSDIVAKVIINTILGGSAGGLTVLFFNRYFISSKKWSYLMTLNGTFAGMVAECSGCNVYPKWAAVIVGVLGGFAYLGGHFGMLALKLDDPLDATAVHGAAGIVGVLCVHFFYEGEGIFWTGDRSDPWRRLGINVLGIIAIAAWSALWSFLLFGVLNYFKFLRIDRELEYRGYDIIRHGEAAYPAEAWVEMQYNATGRNDIPMNMLGTSVPSAVYNDPFKMMPESGRLFSGMKSLAMNSAGFPTGETRGTQRISDSGGDQGQDNAGFVPGQSG